MTQLLPARPAAASRRATSSRTLINLARLDYLILLPSLALSGLGVLMVYSVTRPRLAAAGLNPNHYLQQQATYIVLGLAVMALALRFHYRRYEQLGLVAYAAVIVGLLVVLSPIGSSALGSQRWLALGPFDLQPSAFAGITLILATAAYCHRRRKATLGPRQLAVLLGGTVPAMLLVIKQPDLGTALIMAVVLLAILTIAGLPGRWIAVLVALTVAAVVVVIQLGLLHHYQLQRLTSFLSQGNPGNSNLGVQYNLTQSKLAISSGALTGKGLFQGMMTNLGYVPEQQTDFIFTAVGEQLGLLGAAGTIGCYLLIVWRTWRAAVLARDTFGRLICIGVLAMISFSVFQNVGMVMGIMPITGIPLPFLSYGGSAMIAYFAAIGLVLNVAMNRTPAPLIQPLKNGASRVSHAIRA